MINKIISIAIATVCLSGYAHAAPVVQNGTFSGTVSNNATPSGWNNSGGSINTPDIIDINNNFGFTNIPTSGAPSNFAFDETPEIRVGADTWVGLFGDNSNSQAEQISQTITGFDIGTTYDLSWLEGNFGYDFDTTDAGNALDANASNALRLEFSSADGNSGGFRTNEVFATQSEWLTRETQFFAEDTEYTFTFSLKTGDRSYLSLDDFGITEVVAATSPVPEPSSWAMLLTGALLMFRFNRKKQA